MFFLCSFVGRGLAPAASFLLCIFIKREKVPPCGAGFFSTWKRNQKTLGGGRNRQDRQSQAREWNRITPNFCKPRAQWPGRNLERRSDFMRRKFRSTKQECVPRNRGPGKGDYEHEVLIGAVPGGVLVTLPPRAKSLAARRRRNSPSQQNGKT